MTDMDRLYHLLPVVYQTRDKTQGQSLQALLRVIGEQVQVVEDDIAQLYENWFIETCEEWVVPYLGDLVGYRPVHTGNGAGPLSSDQQKILIPRREVANTILFRRRKGTLALLEELAFTVAGWPARAVEFYKLLAVTQAMQHLRLERGRTVDLRNGQALRDLDGPFEQLAHTLEVRQLNPQPGFRRGFFNIPNIGVFVWRMKSYSMTTAPAFCRDRRAHHYTFSILGNDTQLFVNPRHEATPTDIAGPANLPIPIRRQDFDARMGDYYGPGKSLQIFTGFYCPCREQPEGQSRRKKQMICQRPIPMEQVIAADLSQWERYSPQAHQILVDPEAGRMIVGPDLVGEGIWVTYHYGFASELGGGEYDRSLNKKATYLISKYAVTFRPGQPDQQVICIDPSKEGPINRVLQQWKDDQPAEAIIEFVDNEDYSESLTIDLVEKQRLTLRAANGKRPTIRLLDYRANLVDKLTIRGQGGSRVTLDGLLIEGRSVSVEGNVSGLTIRHCTLVPGWTLKHNCDPSDPNEMSLTLSKPAHLTVAIERSIIGSILLDQDEVQTDPSHITISDSILDATRPDFEALSAGECRHAHAILTIKNSTVFGEIHTHAIDLAENSIFNGVVNVARRQIGCMRFCYVDHTHPETRTPRRYNCQPELAMRLKADSQTAEKERVKPRFKSIRLGTATYTQLADSCAEEITQGADDEGEMGVYHHLYNPQRMANLAARLEEFTPADMEVGIILVT